MPRSDSPESTLSPEQQEYELPLLSGHGDKDEREDAFYQTPQKKNLSSSGTLKFIFAAFGVVILVLLGVIVTLAVSRGTVPDPSAPVDLDSEDAFSPARYVKGPPTGSFRDNLLADRQYVTAWNYAGMTNDWMIYCNLIYLGLISRRIPIIPPFAPFDGHLGKNAPPLNFGEVYDLPRLRKAIQWPVLEWSDVKMARYNGSFNQNEPALDGVKNDVLGCWGVAAGEHPVWSALPDFLHLDVVYVTPPESTNVFGFHASFSRLAALLLPEGRRQALSNSTSYRHLTFKKYLENSDVLPDEQLGCIDRMYHVGDHQAYEWDTSDPVVWNLVATNIHWNQRMTEIGMGYIMRLFGVETGDAIPPFISVHVRRTDFALGCPKDGDKEDCLPQLASIAHRIEQVKKELAEPLDNSTLPLNVTEVIVTSDERNATFWSQVESYGWRYIDHGKEQTSTKPNKWYPPLVDAFVQSKGIGFVGTKRSTMSHVAAMRVNDWNHGVTREVKWGNPDSDHDDTWRKRSLDALRANADIPLAYVW